MNVQDAAIEVLKKAGKPLHAKDLAERVISSGLWKSDGKTPEATILQFPPRTWRGSRGDRPGGSLGHVAKSIMALSGSIVRVSVPY